MDGRFLDAFTLLPQQRVICGYATKPLCLRHRLVLTSASSPFVDGSAVTDPKQVIIAARIISCLTLEEMTSQKPTQHDAEELRKMRDDELYFFNQVESVYKLIQDQSHWPIFWKKKNSAGGKGIPWVLSIICGLVKNGVSIEEAWTMPESQAIWMNATFAASDGADIDIVSDDDLKAQKKLDELYSRLEAEANGG